MDEIQAKLNKQPETNQVDQTNNEENKPVEATLSTDGIVEQEKGQKKKLSKKKIAIIGAVVAVVVIVAIIALIPSKFEKVKNECVQIAGQAATGKNYFSLDTDPDENMDETTRALLLPYTQEKTLKAIRYANRELDFPGSVYSDMLKTTALMGRQSEENSKYKVSWTYHPDHGLEVTYTKK